MLAHLNCLALKDFLNLPSAKQSNLGEHLAHVLLPRLFILGQNFGFLGPTLTLHHNRLGLDFPMILDNRILSFCFDPEIPSNPLSHYPLDFIFSFFRWTTSQSPWLWLLGLLKWAKLVEPTRLLTKNRWAGFKNNNSFKLTSFSAKSDYVCKLNWQYTTIYE